jgi:hypothetical protein
VDVATDAGLDVRAGPAPKVVGGEWGHVSTLRDVGCSELGDGLKTTWSLIADPAVAAVDNQIDGSAPRN